MPPKKRAVRGRRGGAIKRSGTRGKEPKVEDVQKSGHQSGDSKAIDDVSITQETAGTGENPLNELKTVGNEEVTVSDISVCENKKSNESDDIEEIAPQIKHGEDLLSANYSMHPSENEASSAASLEMPTQQKDTAPTTQKDEALVQQKNEVSSQKKDETSQEKGGTLMQQKNEVSSQKKGETSQEKGGTLMQQKNEVSSQKKDETSQEKGGALIQQKDKTSLQQRDNISVKKKSVTSSLQEVATLMQKKNITSLKQKGKTPSQNNKNSQQKNRTSTQQKAKTSLQEKDKTSIKQKDKTSIKQKDKTSTQKKGETSSETKGDAFSQQKDKTFSQKGGETSSDKKSETLSQQKKKTSAQQKNKTSSKQKDTISTHQKAGMCTQPEDKTCSKQRDKASMQQNNDNFIQQQNLSDADSISCTTMSTDRKQGKNNIEYDSTSEAQFDDDVEEAFIDKASDEDIQYIDEEIIEDRDQELYDVLEGPQDDGTENTQAQSDDNIEGKRSQESKNDLTEDNNFEEISEGSMDAIDQCEIIEAISDNEIVIDTGDEDMDKDHNNDAAETLEQVFLATESDNADRILVEDKDNDDISDTSLCGDEEKDNLSLEEISDEELDSSKKRHLSRSEDAPQSDANCNKKRNSQEKEQNSTTGEVINSDGKRCFPSDNDSDKNEIPSKKMKFDSNPDQGQKKSDNYEDAAFFTNISALPKKQKEEGKPTPLNAPKRAFSKEHSPCQQVSISTQTHPLSKRGKIVQCNINPISEEVSATHVRRKDKDKASSKLLEQYKDRLPKSITDSFHEVTSTDPPAQGFYQFSMGPITHADIDSSEFRDAALKFVDNFQLCFDSRHQGTFSAQLRKQESVAHLIRGLKRLELGTRYMVFSVIYRHGPGNTDDSLWNASVVFMYSQDRHIEKHGAVSDGKERARMRMEGVPNKISKDFVQMLLPESLYISSCPGPSLERSLTLGYSSYGLVKETKSCYELLLINGHEVAMLPMEPIKEKVNTNQTDPGYVDEGGIVVIPDLELEENGDEEMPKSTAMEQDNANAEEKLSSQREKEVLAQEEKVLPVEDSDAVDKLIKTSVEEEDDTHKGEVDNKGTEADQSAKKSMEVEQSDNKGTEAEQRDNKGTEVEQRDNKGTKAEQRDNKGTEVEQRDNKGTEVEQRDNKGTEVGQRDNKGTKAEQSDNKGTEAEQRDNKGTEAGQRDNKGTKAEQRDNKGTKAEQRDNKGTEAGQRDNKGTEAGPITVDSVEMEPESCSDILMEPGGKSAALPGGDQKEEETVSKDNANEGKIENEVSMTEEASPGDEPMKESVTAEKDENKVDTLKETDNISSDVCTTKDMPDQHAGKENLEHDKEPIIEGDRMDDDSSKLAENVVTVSSVQEAGLHAEIKESETGKTEISDQKEASQTQEIEAETSKNKDEFETTNEKEIPNANQSDDASKEKEKCSKDTSLEDVSDDEMINTEPKQSEDSIDDDVIILQEDPSKQLVAEIDLTEDGNETACKKGAEEKKIKTSEKLSLTDGNLQVTMEAIDVVEEEQDEPERVLYAKKTSWNKDSQPQGQKSRHHATYLQPGARLITREGEIYIPRANAKDRPQRYDYFKNSASKNYEQVLSNRSGSSLVDFNYEGPNMSRVQRSKPSIREQSIDHRESYRMEYRRSNSPPRHDQGLERKMPQQQQQRPVDHFQHSRPTYSKEYSHSYGYGSVSSNQGRTSSEWHTEIPDPKRRDVYSSSGEHSKVPYHHSRSPPYESHKGWKDVSYHSARKSPSRLPSSYEAKQGASVTISNFRSAERRSPNRYRKSLSRSLSPLSDASFSSSSYNSRDRRSRTRRSKASFAKRISRSPISISSRSQSLSPVSKSPTPQKYQRTSSYRSRRDQYSPIDRSKNNRPYKGRSRSRSRSPYWSKSKAKSRSPPYKKKERSPLYKRAALSPVTNRDRALDKHVPTAGTKSAQSSWQAQNEKNRTTASYEYESSMKSGDAKATTFGNYPQQGPPPNYGFSVASVNYNTPPVTFAQWPPSTFPVQAGYTSQQQQPVMYSNPTVTTPYNTYSGMPPNYTDMGGYPAYAYSVPASGSVPNQVPPQANYNPYAAQGLQGAPQSQPANVGNVVAGGSGKKASQPSQPESSSSSKKWSMGGGSGGGAMVFQRILSNINRSKK